MDGDLRDAPAASAGRAEPAPPHSPERPDPAGLAALAARVREDLEILCLPAKPWVPTSTHDGQPVADVVVVGAGMAGLALTASLHHLGLVTRLIDQAGGGREGPWATTARMDTLRSPKELTGPALGIPSLSFRAWYVAGFGAQAWQALGKIPRLLWADYLQWYREVLGLRVENHSRLLDVQPRADGVSLRVGDPRRPADAGCWIHARHVVLATGRDGLGGPWVPAWAQSLPAGRWMHTGHAWSGERLRGQRVAVIGAGASAMDAAAEALEHGAAQVTLLVRRPDLPRINKSKAAGNPGTAHGFWDLPDDWKWRYRHYINREQVPPPKASVLRVSRHPQARFMLGAPVTGVRELPDGAIELRTPAGAVSVDTVIFATGYRIDWTQRPEFAAIAAQVRRWRDRFPTPPDQADEELANSPDLGPLFEFQAREPGACPGLERVHCFNFAAVLSHGATTGDIPQISDGAQRLARGLAGRLLADDVAHHFDALVRFSEPELIGDEWSAALPERP